MINEIQAHIDKLSRGESLSEEESARAFQIIMHDGATPVQMASLLMGLRIKGETVEEICGAVRAIRARMQRVKAPADAIDTCGTGGDTKGTFNVSTAVAIVIAACGVVVAKHGNRGVSSPSGSADVLAELGVEARLGVAGVEECLRECGIGFMFAPKFHPAMRHVAPVRQELGTRTIFNLLGPLTNPAEPHYQLLGVYSRDWLRPMAEVLRKLEARRAWVVHGEDGLDELSLSGSSYVVELKNGEIREFTVTPEDAGLPSAPLDAIRGGNATHNARAITTLLGGAENAYRNAVLLNAAAALMIAEKAANLKEGATLAAQAIDSGKAKEKLAAWIYLSEQLGHEQSS
jgi:anthranilate phosphoribosyltransferase